MVILSDATAVIKEKIQNMSYQTLATAAVSQQPKQTAVCDYAWQLN